MKKTGGGPAGFPRIVVKAPNWIGDAVLSSALFHEMRRFWPKSHVVVFARKKVLPVMRRLPGVDAVMEEEPGNLVRLSREVRAGRFDIAVSLSSSDIPALAFWLARVPMRIGFKGGLKGFFFSDAVEPPSRCVHQVFHYLKLGEPLGIGIPGNPSLAIRVTRTDRAEAAAFLRRRGVRTGARLVAFAPGASYGPAKRWFTSSWAVVGDAMQLKHRATVVIVGGREERPAALEVGRLMARPAVDATGALSLQGTSGLLSMCRAFLSNDSGLMHLGAAVGVPTLGLFGSSNPSWTAPFGRGNRVIWGLVECAPCYLRKCLPKRNYACLHAIKAQEVCDVLAGLAGFEPVRKF